MALDTTQSTSRIQVLPEVLINQIAAGEVIERPMSIVKELIENSLDAGSSRIEIRLWEGGLKKIQILDNGSGMSESDLSLCLTRHATSKIQNLKDLENISSFGFRGEALASIAAVSRLTIQSRLPEASSGFQIQAEFGLLNAPPRPIGCPSGTSITIEDLFERLPARHKFMRSSGTESSHCTRMIKELAIANAQTQFFLSNPEKRVLEFVSSTLEARFKECFRPHWDPMVVVEENEGVRLQAFLSPSHCLQDRGELWMYVNQRPVKNRGLITAVRQAYSSTLGPHHEPSGVVYLNLRPDWVDVNVHPQKSEVRCYKQEALFPWIVSAIKKEIGKQRTALEVPLNRPLEANRPSFTPTFNSSFSFPAYREERPSAPQVQEPITEYRSPLEALSALPIGPEKPIQKELDTPPSRLLRYLGQIKASYLVCEGETGLYLVDQHALHEKVRTEELKKQHAAGNLSVQKLLIPRILSIPADLLPVLEDHTETFKRLGLDLEIFGERETILRSKPDFVAETDCQDLVIKITEEIRKGRLTPENILDSALHRILATMACHSAIRANHSLTPVEAQSLLDKLDSLELGWTCPHGRPVLFELNYQKIEHYFERS